MSNDKYKNITFLLEAGNVERNHTTPHHGSCSVAKHSWRMLTLLFKLHPRPSIDLIKAVQFHDVGERVYGDVPAYAYNVCSCHKSLEKDIRSRMAVDVELNEEESAWLYYLDKLELLIWCRDQQAMGNRNVEPIAEEMAAIIKRGLDEELIPAPMVFYCANIGPWERLRVEDF